MVFIVVVPYKNCSVTYNICVTQFNKVYKCTTIMLLKMDVSIFGMGYVGCVLAAGYSHLGHNIIGVDIDKRKLALLRQGKGSVVEKGIDKYLKEAVKMGRLRVTSDVKDAVMNSDISIVSVGTPPSDDGSINIGFTKTVCGEIAKNLKDKYHLIVFKSTLFPGTVEGKLIPLIEKISGKKVGVDFGIVHNPEFLREGSGMEDFFNPPVNVFGQLDKKSGNLLEKIYQGIDAPIVRTSIRIGEMIKYVNNTFHGLKVAFANEVGKVAKEFGVDSYELMNIFCMDKQLNISKAYLKPGAPYGGSCLTKDLEALRFEAKRKDIKIPVLNSIKESNDAHIDYCVKLIEGIGKNKIGILGLSFKENTDDLRESPMLSIIDKLMKKGFEIKIYDKNVISTEKFGVNKLVIEEIYPYLNDILLKTIKEVVDSSEVIVIKNRDDEFRKIVDIINENQIIVDFVRLFNKKELKCDHIVF